MVVMILGGNKPAQWPASNSEARKRAQEQLVDPHLWPAEALERVLDAVQNLPTSEPTAALSSTDALRVAPSPLPQVSDEASEGDRSPESDHITYLAQFRDWSDEWRDDGRVFASIREARDGCIHSLSSLGYSGADVRVLRRQISTRVLEILPPEEVRDA